MSIKDLQNKLSPIFREHGVKHASVFGSVSRGDDREDSDVDILVDIDKPIGVYEFIGLQFDLEDALGKKVDLVSNRAVNKYIKPFIEKDLISIYER